MKAFCLTAMIGVFLLICANKIQAQPTQTHLHQIELIKPVSEKTLINAYQRLQDSENLHSYLNKEEKQATKKLKTSKGNPFKSLLVGLQKVDSNIAESWDTTTSQWISYSKEEYTYYIKGNSTLKISTRYLPQVHHHCQKSLSFAICQPSLSETGD